MKSTPPPKWLQWKPQFTQTHTSNKKLLITTGGSYTASTEWFDGPASWPGYLKDFVGFDLVMDVSYPGVGNMYIMDSVQYALNNLPAGYSKDDCLVVIMWTALHYYEQPSDADQADYSIDNHHYQRWNDDYLKEPDLSQWVHQGANFIHRTADFLTRQNIEFSFVYYANLLWQHRLPVIDSTCRFDNYLDSDQLQLLRNLPWACTGDDSLYEYALLNDYLDYENCDGYHPPIECNLDWTKNVLIQGLEKQGKISLC